MLKYNKGDLVTVVSTKIIGVEENYPELYGMVGLVTDIQMDGDVPGYVLNAEDKFFTGFIFDEEQLRPVSEEEVIGSLRKILARS